MWHAMQRRLPVFSLGLWLVVAGCSADEQGPKRYQISGTVTYLDKPVPAGFMTFLPDVKQGNKGPGSGAVIKNGRFRTEPGKGIVGGPHLVQIVGYDGVPTVIEGVDLPEGKALFDPYETTVDFPRQDTTHNVAVPPSSAASASPPPSPQ